MNTLTYKIAVSMIVVASLMAPTFTHAQTFGPAPTGNEFNVNDSATQAAPANNPNIGSQGGTSFTSDSGSASFGNFNTGTYNGGSFAPTPQPGTFDQQLNLPSGTGATGVSGDYTLLEPLPCIPGNGVNCNPAGSLQYSMNFKDYVQYMFNLLIALAAAAAVFMIVFGGLQYMTTDSWNGKTEGRKKAQNALLGLVLVLASYLILRTVDPRLVAIPTTLVAPLNIRQESIGASLVGTLVSDANSFTFESRQADTAAASAIQNTATIQSQLTDAQNSLTALQQHGGSAADIAAAKQKVDGLQKQVTDAQITETLRNSQAEYARRLASISTLISQNAQDYSAHSSIATNSMTTSVSADQALNATLDQADTEKTSLQQSYDQQRAKLQGLGADVATLNALQTAEVNALDSIDAQVAKARALSQGCPNSYEVYSADDGTQVVYCK